MRRVDCGLLQVGLGQEIQTERDKLWHKAQACTDPVAAMRLLARLGYKLHLSPGKAPGTKKKKK